ncbi:MAG: adenylate/guanylate cyclase domain-containing protein [Acidimicrobiales bacterium]
MDTLKRHVAAVMMADVVGFTAMMAADEDGTMAALRAHVVAVDPIISNRGGRIVKTTGDGMLIEFPDSGAAMAAGLEIHAVMKARNETLAQSRRMMLRIGINFAEIIVDETGDIFGDGVNVAARLESIADTGGITVSESVRDGLLGRFEFMDGGFQQLKGVPGTVRVWKATMDAAAPISVSPAARKLATVAVLAFENLSDDPEQEYFADGIAEDLIGAISMDRELAVLPRGSSFAYKGRNLDIRLVARELDATHVVGGTVRRAGDRIRLTAHLVDGESGTTIWSEKLDRPAGDLFDLQDELVAELTTRVRPTVRDAVGRRRTRRPQLDAWDLTIRGQFELNRFTKDGLESSLELFEEARALDPRFATPVAHTAGARLALTVMFGVRFGDDSTPFETARRDAELAMQLDDQDFFGRFALSILASLLGAPEEAAEHARWMIDANPHATPGHHMLGLALVAMGRPTEAIAAQSRAWQLSLHDPMRFDVANDLAWAHFATGAYDSVVAWTRKALRLRNHLQSHFASAAALGLLNRADEAKDSAERIVELLPTFSAARMEKSLIYPDHETRALFIEGLVRAGLPP